MADLPDLGPKPTLEVIPKVGVPPILFGMSEEDVRRVFGGADREYPGFLYYFDGRFQVTFDSGKVHFIELSWSDAHFDVRYKGVSVFHTPAEELVRIISGEPPSAEEHSFTEFELDLALWRPVLPSNSPPEAPDDEYRNGVYWLTIGLGYGHFYGDLMERRERRGDTE